MVPGVEGGVTRHLPSGEVLPIFDAAMRYKAEGTPLVVVAGKEYGCGSSRDWAAKGARLLGVRAVLAEGFERIHRSNLIAMGVLPLQFPAGATRRTLGIDGSERIDLTGFEEWSGPARAVEARIVRADGSELRLEMRCRLDTANELKVWRAGGILPFVLHRLAQQGPRPERGRQCRRRLEVSRSPSQPSICAAAPAGPSSSATPTCPPHRRRAMRCSWRRSAAPIPTAGSSTDSAAPYRLCRRSRWWGLPAAPTLMSTTRSGKSRSTRRWSSTRAIAATSPRRSARSPSMRGSSMPNGDTASVRIHNTNTGKIIVSASPSPTAWRRWKATSNCRASAGAARRSGSPSSSREAPPPAACSRPATSATNCRSPGWVLVPVVAGGRREPGGVRRRLVPRHARRGTAGRDRRDAGPAGAP